MKKSINKTYAIFALLGTVCLIIFSRDCMNAALSGFNMWLCFVMPSVFPFFVCITFMRESGLLNGTSALPLFISSALGGAPSGSKLCAHLSERGYIPSEKLSYYCAACNMVSPAFITGTLCGITGSTRFVLPVLIGHYGASLIFLLVLNNKRSIPHSSPSVETNKSFFDTLCTAIEEGVATCARICGVIVFFTVALSVILKLTSFVTLPKITTPLAFILSLLEMTNGINILCKLSISFPVMCGLIGFAVTFGGICIMVQAAQCARLDAKKYLPAKLGIAFTAGLISYASGRFLPRSSSVFSSAGEALGQAANGSLSLAVIALSSLIGCGSVWLLSVRKKS